MARSRLLYVSGSPLVPSKIGPARRNHHLLQQLARYYDVSVLSVGVPEHEAIIRSACDDRIGELVLVPSGRGPAQTFIRKVWLTATARCDYLPAVHQQLRAACAEFVGRETFDAVVISSLLLGGLPLPTGVPVIMDAHNVEFDIHRRTSALRGAISRRVYAAAQYWPTRRAEARYGRRSGLVLATSDRDRDLFEQALSLPHVAVVPNGIDLTEFQPWDGEPAPAILFSGLLSYYPNQHGVRWFMDAVLPLIHQQAPDARVVFAGAAPPRWLRERCSDRVQVTGSVSDMRPYFGNASVVVAPLMIGGGTRVKILEAQAMERPVVSTTVGAEGLAQQHDETILIADDAASFAAHVVRLLRDPGVAARIARGGRQHVVQHFDWDDIGARLSALLGERFGLSAAEVAPTSRQWGADDGTHRLSTLSHKRAVRAAQKHRHAL